LSEEVGAVGFERGAKSRGFGRDLGVVGKVDGGEEIGKLVDGGSKRHGIVFGGGDPIRDLETGGEETTDGKEGLIFSDGRVGRSLGFVIGGHGFDGSREGLSRETSRSRDAKV